MHNRLEPLTSDARPRLSEDSRAAVIEFECGQADAYGEGGAAEEKLLGGGRHGWAIANADPWGLRAQTRDRKGAAGGEA